ncbi:MAG: GIY-YIG nuclease family protein [Patescibacteria group bacterium]|nr:GIY-YIG nuclease family protein [Patescibacteria group bacterium]
MEKKKFCIYVLSNRFRTVYYVGFTSDISKRYEQHRAKTVFGFTSQYNLTDLVYIEFFEDAYSAIAREKQLKGWRRDKKLELIKRVNPDLSDIGLKYVF